MIAAQNGDAAIMHLRATDLAMLERSAKLAPIRFGFRQQD
jgi:hypothetical protein